MSYEYSKAVYWNDLDTSSSEQAVLAALAFCHNHETGRCDPSIKTLTRMTHLGSATVNRMLSSLKWRGYISWDSGGKGKNGETISNKYTLCLPQAKSPCHSDTPPVSEREGDLITVIEGVYHSDTQKRIEKESKTLNNITDAEVDGKKELVGMLGKRFVEAAKPGEGYKICKTPVSEEAKKAAEKFWTEYPESKWKMEGSKWKFIKRYAELRAMKGDSPAFDEMALNDLKVCRERDHWEDKDKKFIPAPLTFINEILGTVSSEVKAKQQFAERVYKRDDWILCEERCKNFKDCAEGGCLVGYRVPPAFLEWAVPPEECDHYCAKQG